MIFARRQTDLRGRAPAEQGRIQHFQAWTPGTWPPVWKWQMCCWFPDSGRTSSWTSRPACVSSSRSAPASTSLTWTALRQRGIRLATASGVNSNAVSEHAMALILAFTRHIHTGRDRQQRHQWRGMIGDLALREDELGGKTLLIVGLGKIGSRLAKLAKAFDMQVLADKANPATATGSADAVHLPKSCPRCCPRRISWPSPVR